MTLLLAACLIGIVAGMRAMTAPAIAGWAAALGLIGTVTGWPAFMGYRWTAWIFTVAALGEWVTDQLPATPSRKVPVQFAARIIMGGLSGATLGAAQDDWLACLIAGAVGAVLGTQGGAAFRGALARALGNDHPAAFIEDGAALAIGALAIRVML
jgi:uncharacterized membrane protein